MSDIGLFWNSDEQAADFGVKDNDLARDDGLETSVFISLFTDRRAEPGDVLPQGETDRRGWWADDTDDKIGSRLWLLKRAKETQDTLDRAKEYIKESLQWMIDDLVTNRIDVSTSFVTAFRSGLRVMLFEITIFRPETDAVTYRYNYNWAAQEARRVA